MLKEGAFVRTDALSPALSHRERESFSSPTLLAIPLLTNRLKTVPSPIGRGLGRGENTRLVSRDGSGRQILFLSIAHRGMATLRQQPANLRMFLFGEGKAGHKAHSQQ